MTRLTQDGADRIVAFSRDESKRAALQRSFGDHPGVRVYAGDVRDADRLVDLFAGCEVVVHGAARKVVTAHPDEPEELLKTNVLGTMNVIAACRKAGVHKLLVVSSDKACRPENAYGCSKMMGEQLAVNANARSGALRIACVRYGNVLGSTGSVVPVWRRAIERREPITVSAMGMTRFWITMPQAVDLILTALANLRGGEIVVPHIPASDLDTLVGAMVTGASGVTIREVGERQGGEKWHEELIAPNEVSRTRRRNGVYVIAPWQNDHMWDSKPWLGDPAPPGFVYASDVWPYRLDVDAMRRLLQEIA